MAVKLHIPVVGGAQVEIEADNVKKAITESMFWSSLPKVCPICKAALVMFHQERGGYDYYGLECAGRVKHKTDFGAYLEGGGLYYKGLTSKEKDGTRSPNWSYYDYDNKVAVPVLPDSMESKAAPRQDPPAKPATTRPRDTPPIQEDEFPPELPTGFFPGGEPDAFVQAFLDVVAKMGVDRARAVAGAEHIYRTDRLDMLSAEQLKNLTEVFRRDYQKRVSAGKA